MCGQQRTWGLTLVRVGPVANHLSLVRIRMCVSRARRHPPQRGCHAQPSTPALLRHQLRPLSRWVHRDQQVRGAASTCRETHAPSRSATPGLAMVVVVSGRRCTHAAVRGPSSPARSTRRHNIASATLHASPGEVPAAAALRLKQHCAHTTTVVREGQGARAGFGRWLFVSW